MSKGNNGNKDNNVYENLNKLPYIIGDYRVSMIKALKGKFMEQLEIARAKEREYCVKMKIEPVMQGKNYDTVVDLLFACNTLFEIEALARFIFDDNIIPTLAEVKQRALLLSNVFPWEIKH